MKVRSGALLFVGLILAGCSKQASPPAPPGGSTSAGSPVAVTPAEAPVQTPEGAPQGAVPVVSPIPNPLTSESTGGLSDSQRTAVRVLDIASINQAIQMFNVEEDRYPATLEELVEKKYFARLPAPPRGMKYRYNPNTGQIRVVDE